MPFIPEWRHRLLCMRVPLETNSSQSTFHCIYDGPFSMPEYVIKKGRFHWHRYGKLPEKAYHQARNLKKRCKKVDSKGIHDRFLRDHVFRRRMIENNRDEKVCRAWFVLANEDHTYHMSEEESTTCKFGGSLSISQETTPNDWENVLISTKRCLHQNVYIKKFEGIRSSPFRVGRTNNGDRQRVLPLLDGNDKIPGGFLQNSKKIKKKMHAKVYERTERPVVYRSLTKTSDEWLSRIHSILLQKDYLQRTAVYCNRRGVQRQHFKRPVFAMWNMQESGIQIEWRSITATGTPLTTRSTRTTKLNTKPNNVCSDLQHLAHTWACS